MASVLGFNLVDEIKMAPEKILLGILLTLLGISLGLLLFVEIDFEATRNVAIGVCITLALLLSIGVIFPMRRYLQAKKSENNRTQSYED
ncbi:MAG: hypothetical protein ACI97A_000287 [Planctomycetota bacterium]|jgi:hypothetical protein